MGAVAQVVSDVVDPLAQVVGQVEDTIVNAAEQVGKSVEQVGQAVGKTVETMAQHPEMALASIAVAVVAPELAPLLWEGATAADAALVLNAGVQVASGAPPDQVLTNLATGAATMGITSGLDITTGSSIADRALGRAASAAIQGQDINKAIGSSLGSSLVGAGTGAVSSGISSELNAPTPTDTTQTSGFSPEEMQAIQQGQADAAASGPSPYAPTASSVTSDVPTGSVTVTGAPDSATEGKSLEQLRQDLTDGKITSDQFNAAYQSALAPTSLQEYQDPAAQGGLPSDAKATGDYQDPQAEGALPKPSTDNLSGVLGTTTDGNGNTVSTFDDGSTLTTDKDGNVVDFTEATDYQDPETSGTGTGRGGLSIGLGRGASAAKTIRGTRPTSTRTVSPAFGTTPSGATDTSGLSGLGASYGSNLTPATSSGNPEYSLFGEMAPQEQMAEGGPVQHMATGSTPDTQGVYDLSTTVSSPFLGGGSSPIMALKPGLIKGKINYALPGYPFGQEWKLAAAGGAIDNAPEGHNPQFYSEGGLNSLQHTYLKGGGDGTSDSIPAMLANGEFVIPADVVSSLGNGSSDSGAKVLDEFLRTIRAHKRKADPKKLPPDSKGVKGYLLEAKKKVKK